MGDKKIFIYYLHQGDNIPFYIGKTTNEKERRSAHKRKYGANTQLEILQEVDKDSWKKWETYFIQQYKEKGYMLKNKNQGGGGCDKHSLETRKLISKKTTGLKRSKETRERMSKAQKGKPRNLPSNHGELISKAKKGIPNPKLREARLGKPHPKKVGKCFAFQRKMCILKHTHQL